MVASQVLSTAIKAEPHVELQDGAVKRDDLAREVTGAEKACVATWPDYARYQAKTERQIRCSSSS